MKKGNKKSSNKTNQTVYHIGKNMVPAICKAVKGKCPFGGRENHFTSLFEAEKVARRILEGSHEALPFMKEKTTEAKLKDHQSKEEFFNEIKKYIKALKKKKKTIEKSIEKSYMTYLEECAKDGIENVISREKFSKPLLKKIPDYQQTCLALEYKEEMIRNAELERTQTEDFLNHITPQDLSYSSKTTSAYFIVGEQDWEKTKKYLEDNGYTYQIRPGAEEMLKNNFEIRFANHMPSKMYYKRNIDLWDATDATILVDYKKEVIPMPQPVDNDKSSVIEYKRTEGKPGIPNKKFKLIVYRLHKNQNLEYNGQKITKDNIYEISKEIMEKNKDSKRDLMNEANILRIAYKTMYADGLPFEEVKAKSLELRTQGGE